MEKFSKTEKIIVATAAMAFWAGAMYLLIKDSEREKKDTQIDVVETFKKSPFSRAMLIDIGALTTIISAWLFVVEKSRIKYVLMALVWTFGSFAALPAISFTLLKSVFEK